MDLVIRFRSAVALAGRFPVLAGVDLDVVRGDVVLLRGANGAGKTSLLRACAGLLRVVAGEASVLGHDLVQDQRGVRRQVGLLGHHTALYDEMSAAENLRFALRAARAPVSSAGPAMELLGITGRLASTPVGSLSAGQRRRVALAVLVARSPEIWLLDEPHAGLDAEYRDLLDSLIAGAGERGTTVVLASHEADRAGPLARTIVTISGGMVAGVQAAAAGPGLPAPPATPGLPAPPAGQGLPAPPVCPGLSTQVAGSTQAVGDAPEAASAQAVVTSVA
jgi:heme ABC exporter ATP-binding subunit CcmA